MRGRAALGLVLLGAGVLGLLHAADVVQLSYTAWIGVLLIAIGLAIAIVPGKHRLLIVLGIVIVLAALPALVIDGNLLDEGVGEEVVAPESSADIERFEHGIGKLTVDLTAADLPLDGLTVEAALGIGELVVLVPDDTDVTFEVHVGAGNAEAFGETEDGVDVDLDGVTGTSGSQEVRLEAEVGVGNLRIARGP